MAFEGGVTEDLKTWDEERWDREAQRLKDQCRSIRDAALGVLNSSEKDCLLGNLSVIRRYVKETLLEFLSGFGVDRSIVKKFQPILHETLRAVDRNRSRLCSGASRAYGQHDYNDGSSSIVGVPPRGRHLGPYYDDD